MGPQHQKSEMAKPVSLDFFNVMEYGVLKAFPFYKFLSQMLYTLLSRITFDAHSV